MVIQKTEYYTGARKGLFKITVDGSDRIKEEVIREIEYMTYEEMCKFIKTILEDKDNMLYNAVNDYIDCRMTYEIVDDEIIDDEVEVLSGEA